MKYEHKNSSLIIAFVILLFNLGNGIWAAQYKATGDLEYWMYGRKGTNDIKHHVTGKFQAIVDGCKWQIEYSSSEEEKNGIAKNVIGINDAGEVCILTTFKKGVEARDDPKNQYGQVFSSPNNLGMSYPFGALVWWALCSSCNIQTNDTTALAPIVIPDPQFSFLYYKKVPWKSNFELLSESPSLPKKTEYLNDGTRRYWDELSSLAMMQDNYLEEPYPGRWKNGFTNSIFEVKSTIVTNQLTLPHKFEYKRFSFVPGVISNGKLIPIVETHGKINKIEFGNSLIDSLPDPEMRVTIADHRFASDDDPVYSVGFSANKWKWMSKEEVRKSREYQNAVQQQQVNLRVFERTQRILKNQKKSTNGLMIGFALISLVFIILIWRIKKAKQKQ